MPNVDDNEQAINKAWKFADTAYSVEMEKSARQTQEKVAKMRNKYAASGSILSGTTVSETVDIYGDHITALLKSRLALLLEGFAMYGVTIDDGLMQRVIKELEDLRSTMISNARGVFVKDPVMSRGLV